MELDHQEIEPIEEITEKYDVVIIDDDRWEELVKLTNGAAAQCYQCGTCTAVCPWGLVRGETVSVRKMMRQAQIGLSNGDEDLWLCTTCGQCETYCPRGVNITEVFRGLRNAAWNRGKPEEGLPTLLWSVYWNNNPWSQAPSHRSKWAADLNLPKYDSDIHEVLYYIGCTSSYDQRAQKVARSLVKIFESADTSFGVLGDDEPCCGEAVMNVGHRPYFNEIVDKNSNFFEKNNVTQMITVSPHCFDVFANHYPKTNPNFNPQHYTQYLSQLILEERLNFKTELNFKITFQDPCYLSRHNNEVDAPRIIINTLPGVEFVEMEQFGKDTLCCGGGGGRMWLETEASERFADIRIKQAVETGSNILATACPSCISCLEDSVKAQKIEGLKVMDIAEIAVLAL